MALIRCSECSNQVSSEAKTCPHCGFKLRKFKDSKFAKETKNGFNELLAKISIFGPLVLLLIFRKSINESNWGAVIGVIGIVGILVYVVIMAVVWIIGLLTNKKE